MAITSAGGENFDSTSDDPATLCRLINYQTADDIFALRKE